MRIRENQRSFIKAIGAKTFQRIGIPARHLVPGILFGIVTIYLTYPIPFHLGSLVLGRPFDDAFESIWYLYWYKHALFDLGVSPFFQPDIFYPLGWDLGFAVMPPFYPALLAPLTALVGHVASYNLALIGSCIFAAYGAYMLSRVLGANMWGGVLAGVAFAFYPNRQVYLSGFLNLLLGSMWLPWMLYGVVQARQRPKSRTRWMALAGLAHGLSVAGAWQFAIIGTVLLLIFGTVYLWAEVRRKWRGWIVPVSVAMLASLLVAGPLLANAALRREEMESSAVFSLRNLEGTSVSVERLFVPSALNPLVWDLSRKDFPLTNGEDGVVSFGVIPVSLALVAILRLRPWSRRAKALLVVVSVGLLLMLGPTLRFWGKPVTLQLPGTDVIGRVTPGLIGPEGSLKIPLPAIILYWLVPPFRSFHHFGRWGLMVSLSLATLAALGFTHVAKRSSSRLRLMVGILLVSLLVVEFNTQPFPTITSVEQMQRSVDDWLAARPEQSVIIEYPLWYTMKSQSLYYTIAHEQKIVHGSSLLSDRFLEILPTLERWPDDVALDLLEKIGVRYVLVQVFEGQDFEAETLPLLQSIPRLRLIDRFATPIGPIRDIYLFELGRPASFFMLNCCAVLDKAQ